MSQFTGELTCTFCDKSQREVKKLFSGDHALLCDECLGLCNDIIYEAPPDTTQPRQKGPNVCSLCGSDEGYKYVAGPGCLVCDACVERANEIIVEECEENP